MSFVICFLPNHQTKVCSYPEIEKLPPVWELDDPFALYPKEFAPILARNWVNSDWLIDPLLSVSTSEKRLFAALLPEVEFEAWPLAA